MFTLDYLLEHQGRTPSNWGFINKDGKVNLVVFENENILNMTKDKKYFEEMKNKIAKVKKSKMINKEESILSHCYQQIVILLS